MNYFQEVKIRSKRPSFPRSQLERNELVVFKSSGAPFTTYLINLIRFDFQFVVDA